MRRILLKVAALVSLLIAGMNARAIDDVNGVYQIGTPQNLTEFSELVNAGNTSANAVLTADIDMGNVENFTPIAKHYTIPYSGVFDGLGHIISNLRIDINETDTETGLFFRVDGAIIKNVGIVNATVKNPSAYRIGVLGGAAFNSQIINCFTAGNIELENASKGGLFGLMSKTTMTDCYTTYQSMSDFPDCNLVNTYWGVDAVAWAPTGELCYKLNGDQSTITWYQTLGHDAFPVLDATHKRVYTATKIRCDGVFMDNITYTNDPDQASNIPEHKFENGICTVCGQDVNGVYQIGTAEKLVAFSELVNKGKLGANAVLTADIDMSSVDNFTPIARHYTFPYSGIFDGQGHVISNLRISMNQADTETGLFFRVDGGIIKNVGIVNATVKNPSAYRIGVLGGAAFNSQIINCFTAGDIELENASKGGLFGLMSKTTMTNCYTTYQSMSDFPDCNLVNTYWGENAAAWAPTGELCYKLNGDQSAITWFQTLGKDAFPVLNSTHSQVYVIGDMKCDGSFLSDNVSYTNNKDAASQKPAHKFENGVCTVCGQVDTSILNPDANGVYQISTAEALVRFSLLVCNGGVSANAVLTADIDMSSVENFTPIAKHYNSPYSGVFDGQGHIISNLNIDMNVADTETGLFFRVDGGTIKNLGIVNATVKNPSAYRIGVLGGAAFNSQIINCFTAGDIELENASKGGLFGLMYMTTMTNCYTTYQSMSDFPDCNLVNTYWGEDAIGMAPTGELCYKLNGGNIQNPVWRQSTGYDEYPMFDTAHGIVNQIGTTGYATQYIAESNVMIPEGVTAYTGFIDTPWIALRPLTNIIPAGAAVVLQGDAGYYSFIPVSVGSTVKDNDLKGTAEPLAATGAQYVLAEKDGVIGFYKAEGTIPAGKAYVEYTGAAGVKGFFFDNANGIENLQMVNGKSLNGKWYDLSGRRVEKATKGIYIVNGKKIAIK